MERVANEVVKWQQFALEVIALWIGLHIPFIIISEMPPSVAYFTSVLLAVILYYFLKFILKDRVTVLYIYLLSPLILISLITLGFNFHLAVIAAAFIVWRLAVHEEEPDLENENLVIGISVLLALFSFFLSYMHDFVYKNQTFILFLIQLGIMFIGKWISFFVYDEFKEKVSKKFLTVFTLLVVIFGVTALLFLTFPFVKQIVFTALSFVAASIGYVLMTIFGFLANQLNLQINREYEQDVEEVELGQNEVPDMTEISGPVISANHLAIAVTIIFTLIVIYLLYKNKDRLLFKSKREEEEKRGEYVQSIAVNKRRWRGKRRGTKPPANDIRKAFYKLELWAAKEKLGRYNYESIEDWLKRYRLNHLLDEEVIHLYRNVRYGNFEVAHEQKRAYLQQLENLKAELKKLKKGLSNKS